MKKISLLFVLAAVLIVAGCAPATRIVAVGEAPSWGQQAAYLPPPRAAFRQQEEESPVVLQARAIGRKMAKYKRDRERACVELKYQLLGQHVECVSILGPVEMKCWVYGNGNYSCNPQ